MCRCAAKPETLTSSEAHFQNNVCVNLADKSLIYIGFWLAN